VEVAMNAPLQTSSHFRPATRLSSIGVSEILKITGLATDLKRQGKDVIILGTGEPDFDTPAHIKDAAARAMQAGATKYTALDGTPELKSAIRAKFRRDNGLEFAQDEITVSSGAKQILYNAMMASLDPGDEVIIPTPFWVSYADIVLIAGGQPVLVPCSEANGFRLTAGDLEAAITPRTRWVMLNSPSNPTGAAFAEADYRPILDLLLRHQHVWLIVDDIYEHIVYDGAGHTPIATLPGMADRTVTISGISKSYSVTGWRVGYAIASAELSLGIRRAHDFITVGAPHPLQEAAVTALEFPDSYYTYLRESYQARRDLLFDQVEAAGFIAWKPRGAYYILTEAAHFMKRYDCPDDTAFAMHLIKEVGVATVPGSSFYAHAELGRTKIRFCFPKTDDMLIEAGRRLQKLAR